MILGWSFLKIAKMTFIQLKTRSPGRHVYLHLYCYLTQGSDSGPLWPSCLYKYTHLFNVLFYEWSELGIWTQHPVIDDIGPQMRLHSLLMIRVGTCDEPLTFHMFTNSFLAWFFYPQLELIDNLRFNLKHLLLNCLFILLWFLLHKFIIFYIFGLNLFILHQLQNKFSELIQSRPMFAFWVNSRNYAHCVVCERQSQSDSNPPPSDTTGQSLPLDQLSSTTYIKNK